MAKRNKPVELDDSLIDYSRPHTHQEIADALGLTKMRVCQIEKAALEKIARMTMGKRLKDFLYD